MSMNDLLSDMITRIRNGQQARLATIKCPSSKLLSGVLDVMKREGYIREWSKEEVREGIANITIELKYYEGEPVIKEIKRLSTPGRRSYSQITALPKVHNGLGISILSTSKGVMSDFEARQANVGGEVLCSVY